MGKHVKRLAFLVAFATVIQGVTICRNSTPAQDAINFIQFGRQLEHHPVMETLRSNSQHPLYPVVIWAQHSAMVSSLGQNGSSWVRAAQLAAAGAAILLVIPMYFATVRVVRPGMATAAVALFSVLPITARLGADAVADS